MSSGSTTLVPRRVLIADDNTDAADSTAMLLQSLGHDTCVVYNGTEALKMTADFRPHVLLLDLGMAGLDGYEVARRLQALKEKWRFRIVALTGWGQAADRDRSRAAGFDAHLVKPVDPRELVRIVNDAEQ